MEYKGFDLFRLTVFCFFLKHIHKVPYFIPVLSYDFIHLPAVFLLAVHKCSKECLR